MGVEAIAATFKKRTSEAKVEVESMAMLTPLGAFTGIAGAQASHQQLDTSGEALLFPARTRTAAVYFLNEIRHAPTLRTRLAGRIEAVNVTGTAVTFPADFLPPLLDPAGTPAERNFQPASIAFSVIKDLPSDLVAGLTLQRIERAPTALELFSKGPHDATGTFDIGNAGLVIETAKSVEIGLKRTQGAFRFDGKAYHTRYDNFIFQAPTGNFCDAEFTVCGPAEELLQTFISQRDAIFRGAELAWQWDVMPLANGISGGTASIDTLRATFTDGSNVPRIPPTRLGGGAYWRNDNWFVRMGLLHAFAQTDIAPVRNPDCGGYNLLERRSCTANSCNIRPGGRSRSPPASPATICSTSTSAIRPVPQGRDPAARAQFQIFPQRQIRCRAPGRPARRLLQGAQRPGWAAMRRAKKPHPPTAAP